MEALLRDLQIDLSQGLEVLNASQLANRAPAGDLPLLIQNQMAVGLAATRSVLARRYPAAHPVLIWHAGGWRRIRLDELEQQDWADYGTSLYLPPLGPSGPGETDPQRWVGLCWSVDPLIEVMAHLRSAEGCPWDREQTHQSLRRYLLEEAYEAVEAIDEGDPRALCEELGDVLLQVVFHAQVAREAGTFDFHQVVRMITEKLVRRHPHVFGDAVAKTAAEVTQTWEAVKRVEKGGGEPESLLSGLSKALPALSRADALQRRAAKVGFDWEDIQGPVKKVQEELAEVLAADPADQEGEIGDLLFAVVNLARKLKIDPEIALTGANAKFSRRFRYIEKRAAEMGLKLGEMRLSALDRLWEEGKGAEFRKK